MDLRPALEDAVRTLRAENPLMGMREDVVAPADLRQLEAEPLYDLALKRLPRLEPPSVP